MKEPEEIIEAAIVQRMGGVLQEIDIIGALSPAPEGERKKSADTYISVFVDLAETLNAYKSPLSPCAYSLRITVHYAMPDDATGAEFRDACRRVRRVLSDLSGDNCVNLNGRDFCCDDFALGTSSSDALKVTSSNENRSKQSASGQNLYGDAAKVDSWGETAAPSAEYTVVKALTQATFPDLGTVHTVDGIENPVVLGSVTISTRSGSAPTVSVSGQMVQTGATQLRKYSLPNFSLTPRHRAQDFMGLCSIKSGSNAADPAEDYGLESVEAQFPIEFTLAQPKGEVANYDLHGGMATCSYTMNWYASTAPTVSLTTAATSLGATLSSPVAKSCPEGGYTQYTWTVSFPMLGEECTANS